MSSIRVSGNTSGYYDLTVPDVAGTNTIPLNQVVTTDSNGHIQISGGSTNNDDTAAVITAASTEHAKIRIDTSSTSNHRATLAMESGSYEVNIATSGLDEMRFSTQNTSDAFFIGSNGNIGVGTTVPVSKLHVARNNNNTSQASKAGAFTLRTQEDDGMEWHLSHSSNGYVGWAASAKINNYGGSWGDAYLEFATAGASGGNGQAALRMHQGITTQPNVPAFDAYYTSNTTWSVGASNTLVFNATTFNQGGHYDTSNGRFTAPVSGVYHFTFYSIILGNYTNGDLDLYVNGGRGNGTDRHFTIDTGSNWNTISGSNTRYLNAGDYVMVFTRSGGSFHGGYWSNFSGHLVG